MPRRKSQPMTQEIAVSSPIDEVFDYLGIDDIGEYISETVDLADDPDWQTKKYVEERFRAEDMELDEDEARVYDERFQRVMEEMPGELRMLYEGAILRELTHAGCHAIEVSALQAGAKSLACHYDGKGDFTVEAGEDLVRVWGEEVQGTGIEGWGGDESLSDVTSVVMVMRILDNHAEVYGNRRLERIFENSIARGISPDIREWAEWKRAIDKIMEGKQ